MPTNDERREVAARLRVLASSKAADEELTLDALGLYRGNNIEGFDTHCVMCLADLIEPEQVCIANITITAEQIDKIKADVLKELEQPGRTCRMTKKGHEFVLAGWWECSECGTVYPPCNEEIALWALQYCPHCGAKVVC